MQGLQTKIYQANISQTSTSAPTEDVIFKNSIGTITWGYTSTGIYTGTCTGAFTADKTKLSIAEVASCVVSIVWTSANVITVKTELIDGSGVAVANAKLADTLVTIEVTQ